MLVIVSDLHLTDGTSGRTINVNEDSPGIETMPDITPEMISPNPPQSNSENNQNDQTGSSNVESD